MTLLRLPLLLGVPNCNVSPSPPFDASSSPTIRPIASALRGSWASSRTHGGDPSLDGPSEIVLLRSAEPAPTFIEPACLHDPRLADGRRSRESERASQGRHKLLQGVLELLAGVRHRPSVPAELLFFSYYNPILRWLENRFRGVSVWRRRLLLLLISRLRNPGTIAAFLSRRSSSDRNYFFLARQLPNFHDELPLAKSRLLLRFSLRDFAHVGSRARKTRCLYLPAPLGRVSHVRTLLSPSALGFHCPGAMFPFSAACGPRGP